MNATAADLRGLSRDRDPSAPASTVPMPARRWRTRVMLPGLILLIVAALLLATSAQSLLPAAPVRVVPVVIRTVEGTAGTVTVQAPGWLEPDPHPYYVTALADGVVEAMLILEGDRIEPGQVVARLVDEDARLALRRAESELVQRRADRASAQAEVEAARLRLEHLVERTRAVDVAEAAVAEATAELERVRADIAVERAVLLEIEDEHDRKASLIESQAVSEATVARLRLRGDAQRATVDATLARAGVLRAKLDRAEAERRAARRDRELLIDEHRAVSLAEAAVARADAAVGLAEAARDEAALRLERMDVRSTVGGIVLQRLATPGSQLRQGGGEYASHVVHVYDPDHLQVRVDVPLAEVANVSVGQSAEITVEVLPDRTFAGRVTRVVHLADIQKNTVEVKVAVEDPSSDLKPEMLARVRFIATSAPESDAAAVRQRVFAPERLVRGNGAAGAAALVVSGLVEDRGRVERRSVVTGSRIIDGWIEIESGLRAGDLLVANPSADLGPGDRVRVVGEEDAP